MEASCRSKFWPLILLRGVLKEVYLGKGEGQLGIPSSRAFPHLDLIDRSPQAAFILFTFPCTSSQPEELISAQELLARKKKREEEIRFFTQMEKNILARMDMQDSLPMGPTTPFSPTQVQSRSTYSASSADSDSATTISAKEFVPSLLSVPSSASDISKSSTTASSTSSASLYPSHQRRNTTGTISLKETPFTLDVDGTIQSICTVYRVFIVESMSETLPSSSPASVHDIFADLEASVFDDSFGNPFYRCKGNGVDFERRSQHVVDDPHGANIPSLEEITFFVTYVYDNCQMESDVLIPCLLYCERIMTITKGAVQPNVRNWRSILLSCLLLASKVWDDCSMWPVDFSCVCRKGPTSLQPFNLRRINELEVAFLKLINFNAHISASEYTRCYFYLQELSLPATSKHFLDIERSAAFGMLKLKSLDAEFLDTKASYHRRGSSFDEQEMRCGEDYSYERSASICLEKIVTM